MATIVNLLPSADYIIALGKNGEVVEQGKFQELNAIDGYVRSFAIQHAKSYPDAVEDAPSKITLEPKQIPALVDAMDEKKRQLGDMSVYMYYFKSIGTMTTILFFLYSALFAGLSTIRSEYYAIPLFRDC